MAFERAREAKRREQHLKFKARARQLETHIEAIALELRMREMECPNVTEIRRELERILE